MGIGQLYAITRDSEESNMDSRLEEKNTSLLDSMLSTEEVLQSETRGSNKEARPIAAYPVL